jgi:hypothetical protein
MKHFLTLFTASIVLIAFSACNSGSSKPATFADTTCTNDTIKFSSETTKHANVRISIKDCAPEYIIWSNDELENDIKKDLSKALGSTVRLNKNYSKVVFADTTAWVFFNDCVTGRSYQIKLSFAKTLSFKLNYKGINSIDKRFAIADNLVVSTDRGNIFVEDMYTGKTAVMTFGKVLDIDFDNIHDHIDSVNITNDRIWAKFKLDNQWTEKEKKIVLE